MIKRIWKSWYFRAIYNLLAIAALAAASMGIIENWGKLFHSLFPQ